MSHGGRLNCARAKALFAARAHANTFGCMDEKPPNVSLPLDHIDSVVVTMMVCVFFFFFASDGAQTAAGLKVFCRPRTGKLAQHRQDVSERQMRCKEGYLVDPVL